MISLTAGRTGLVVITGLLLEGAYFCLAVDRDMVRPGAFVPLFLLANIPYLAVVYRVARGHATSRALLLGFALLFRITLLAAPPALSDDIYRYRWDGRVQATGLNPYMYAPDASALAGLRDEAHARINHPEIPTVYPPVSQILFLATDLVWDDVLAFRALAVLFDLLTAAVLARLARRLGAGSAAWAIYAWNPLVVVEFSLGGHCDSIMLFFLVLALDLHTQSKGPAWAASLAASAGAKLTSLLALPLLLQGRRKLAALAIFAAAPAVLFAPYLGSNRLILPALQAYSLRWRFNDSLFWLLDEILRGSGLSARFSATVAPWFDPGVTAQSAALHQTYLLLLPKAVCAVILGAALVVLARQPTTSSAGRVALPTRLLLLFGLFLLLSPTVHPWYLTLLVPFLVFAPRGEWLLLTALAEAAHLAGAGPQPTATLLARGVVYLPFFALLAARFLRRCALASDRPALEFPT